MDQAAPASDTTFAGQHPINSGFSAASTTNDVMQGIDLTGKTVIVTGGYAGLGLETARTLAAAGATVIVPARNQQKAQASLAGTTGIELETLDLMDPASIDAFAERFLASGRPLHLLINNAGIMWVPLQRDARGYESQLSTNHLGHFQLTARLWPALKQAQGARVINVSSWGHRFSPFHFEDPHFEHRAYETLLGYGQSKTANNLFSVALDQRGQAFGVRSFSLHPGAIADTDLKRHLSTEQLNSMGLYDAEGKTIHEPSKGLKTIAQGASTIVWCATSPQLNGLGGLYCEDNEVAQLDTRQPPFAIDTATAFTRVMAYSLEPASAQQLWTLSEQLTGVPFAI
jgi:NAD(P)-dependent dehydrogenase (short-subunit alcohol dehydrogenase family)